MKPTMLPSRRASGMIDGPQVSILFAFFRGLVVLNVSCWDGGTRQVGDGRLIDQGFFSYWPRYRIEFPAIGFSDLTQGSYRTTSCPKSEYSLRLILLEDGQNTSQSAWSRLWTELEEAEIVLTITIVQETSSGQDWRFEGQLPHQFGWGPGRFGEERYFQALSLNGLPLQGEIRIEIRVATKGRPIPENLELKLVLVGGGIVV